MIMKQRLTKSQETMLSRHSAHHTKAHMDFMKRRMLMGDSFTEAHRKAQQKIGK